MSSGVSVRGGGSSGRTYVALSRTLLVSVSRVQWVQPTSTLLEDAIEVLIEDTSSSVGAKETDFAIFVGGCELERLRSGAGTRFP